MGEQKNGSLKDLFELSMHYTSKVVIMLWTSLGILAQIRGHGLSMDEKIRSLKSHATVPWSACSASFLLFEYNTYTCNEKECTLAF